MLQHLPTDSELYFPSSCGPSRDCFHRFPIRLLVREPVSWSGIPRFVSLSIQEMKPSKWRSITQWYWMCAPAWSSFRTTATYPLVNFTLGWVDSCFGYDSTPFAPLSSWQQFTRTHGRRQHATFCPAWPWLTAATFSSELVFWVWSCNRHGNLLNEWSL